MSIFGKPVSDITLNENTFLNKEDVKHNLSKWGTKLGQDNILYVTGLSGGGKTTISKEYSEKYGAEILELDLMDYKWDATFKNKFILKAFNKFPLYKSLIVKSAAPFVFDNKKDYNDFIKVKTEATEYIIDLMHKESDKLFIIEGIQILYDDFPIDIEKVPLVIKGTSNMSAIIRRVKRGNNDQFSFEDFVKTFKDWYRFNNNQDRQIIKLRKQFDKEYKKRGYDTCFNVIPVTESVVLQEAYKSKRKYKCPYCNYHNIRMKLISHIDKAHKDMIPEGYSAGRLLYDLINTSPNKAKCRICGKPTEWNEDKLRYEVFCSDSCKKKYSDDFHKIRMVNIYGVESLLDNPEMQAKMLAGRRISGYYKFQDGVRLSYCGSYEKNLLEFLDKVMNYSSHEVTSPGPVIEYEYKGKKHFWVTDQYIGLSNLVIDCKDGGSNPNKRDMQEYREKQIAKEEAIKKLHKYNYIRLTDNNFSQLIDTLMTIKYEMLDNPMVLDNPVIDINESGLANGPAGNAMVGTGSYDSFIIPYKPLSKTFDDDNTEYALSFDKSLTDLYIINDEGNIKHESIEFLYDKKFDVFKSKNKVIFEMDEDIHPKNYFCMLALGTEYITESAEKVDISYFKELTEREIMCESIIYECQKDDPLNILSEMGEIQVRVEDRYLMNIYLREDVNGYFIYDKERGLRTKSYNTVDEAMNAANTLINFTGD